MKEPARRRPSLSLNGRSCQVFMRNRGLTCVVEQPGLNRAIDMAAAGALLNQTGFQPA